MSSTAPDPTAQALPRPHPQVVARTLPDGAVLFHPATETYFGLNATGTVVWEAIGAGAADVATVIARLVAEHPDVAPEQVRADVLALLDDLAAAGLVER
jgi:PqqD family protein of HPr-rel-A system